MLQVSNIAHIIFMSLMLQRHGSGDPTLCGGYPAPACWTILSFRHFDFEDFVVIVQNHGDVVAMWAKETHIEGKEKWRFRLEGVLPIEPCSVCEGLVLVRKEARTAFRNCSGGLSHECNYIFNRTAQRDKYSFGDIPVDSDFVNTRQDAEADDGRNNEPSNSF